jgi:hypothetical protein
MNLHDAYANHIMQCKDCFAPKARYCTAGADLRADYLVDFILAQDRSTSRGLMVAEKRDNPHLYPLINERVRARQASQEGQANG